MGRRVMPSRWSWFISAVALLLPHAVSGQICAGLAGFTESRFQAFGTAAFNDGGRALGGGVSFGGAGPFGHVTLGIAWYDDIEGISLNAGVGAGYQVKLDRKGNAFLCPTASIAAASGPHDVDVFGDGSFLVDFSEFDVLVGIAFGMVGAQSGETKILPTASLSFVSATVRAEDQASGVSDSESESFGVVGAGIGFLVNRAVTLHPRVSLPLGLEGASVSFSATVSVSFGRASP